MPGGHYVQSSPAIPPKGLTWKGVSRQPALQRSFRAQRSEQGIFLLAHCYRLHGGCSLRCAVSVSSRVPTCLGEFLWCHSQVEVSGSWGEIQLGRTEPTIRINWNSRWMEEGCKRGWAWYPPCWPHSTQRRHLEGNYISQLTSSSCAPQKGSHGYQQRANATGSSTQVSCYLRTLGWDPWTCYNPLGVHGETGIRRRGSGPLALDACKRCLDLIVPPWVQIEKKQHHSKQPFFSVCALFKCPTNKGNVRRERRGGQEKKREVGKKGGEKQVKK